MTTTAPPIKIDLDPIKVKEEFGFAAGIGIAQIVCFLPCYIILCVYVYKLYRRIRLLTPKGHINSAYDNRSVVLDIPQPPPVPSIPRIVEVGTNGLGNGHANQQPSGLRRMPLSEQMPNRYPNPAPDRFY